MRFLGVLLAIGLLKTTRGLWWAGERLHTTALWILVYCDPATRGR